ncbi:hypothetical protein EMIT0158MI4_180104 [Burkholderia ambifaria]
MTRSRLRPQPTLADATTITPGTIDRDFLPQKVMHVYPNGRGTSDLGQCAGEIDPVSGQTAVHTQAPGAPPPHIESCGPP